MSSTTSPTSASSTSCSRERRRDERDGGGPESQEIGCPVRRAGGQYRLVHGRAKRERPALPRLRHPRLRRRGRVRGNRPPARSREIADPRGARGVQGEAQGTARAAGGGRQFLVNEQVGDFLEQIGRGHV